MLVLALLSLQSLRAITMFMYRSARRVFPPLPPDTFCGLGLLRAIAIIRSGPPSCLAVGDGFRYDSTVEIMTT